MHSFRRWRTNRDVSSGTSSLSLHATVFLAWEKGLILTDCPSIEGRARRFRSVATSMMRYSSIFNHCVRNLNEETTPTSLYSAHCSVCFRMIKYSKIKTRTNQVAYPSFFLKLGGVTEAW